MPKTVRRFQFQPGFEGLDRRIAPTVGGYAPPPPSGGDQASDTSTNDANTTTNDADTTQTTNVKVYAPPGGGTSPPSQ